MVEKSLESRRRHMTKCVHGQSDPVDCSLLGSSVHGTFQGRILECIVIACSRGSS